MTSGLLLDGVSVVRAGTRVVREVTLNAPAGEVTVVVGPNGAGKTSLMEAVSGLVKPQAGRVLLGGRPLPATRSGRAAAGVTHVEQGRTVFTRLTVEDNLRVVADDPAPAWKLFPELRRRADGLAGSLSGGEQQMLVIARALLREPRALLIDELSLGLAPVVLQRIVPVLRAAADQGIAVLLVEQFVSLALEVGDSIHVLVHGELTLSATCAELRAEPDRLTAAYFGAAVPDRSA